VRSNLYTYLFTGAVCIGCSLFVSLSAVGLRSRQLVNEKVDLQRNILRSVGIPESPEQRLTPAEVQRLFQERLRGVVVDAKGNVVAGRKPQDVDPEKDADLLPVYLALESGKVAAYSFPVSGKGLWSTLYGYLALAPDGVTIKGITYYKHGETPGLGAEVDKPWFQRNFQGKKILDKSGKLRPVAVVKGKVADSIPQSDRDHYVDGISGATLTGNGVTMMIAKTLARYEPFFSKVRAGEAEGLL
jgi:Na+-transporting NADH:ubiquinone oxidoreductase subunit C